MIVLLQPQMQQVRMGAQAFQAFSVRMIWMLHLCVLGLLVPLTTIVAAQETAEPLVGAYVSGRFSVDEILSGASGEVFLLYYLAEKGPEKPAIVVRLLKEEDARDSVATVFDAPRGQTFVPVQFVNGYPTIPDQLIPAVTLVARDGWWLRGRLVNYNLDIEVNGPVMAMWAPGGIQGWSSLLDYGEPNAKIVVRDTDRDGLAEWDFRTMLPEFPNQSHYRTAYVERKCSAPLRIEGGPFPKWPFIGGDPTLAYEQGANILRPPIVVDWAAGRVRIFSEVITLRNQNCSYGIYSVVRVLPGQINSPDFETPFAFYDLSGQGQGLPNLIVRAGRTILEQEATGMAARMMEVIRYSWSNEDVGDLSMDYKVEVLGFHPYDFETPIAGGQASIDAPPYDLFPQWVIGKAWPVVTFIDTEDVDYLTSEGIYEWAPGSFGAAYFLGYTDQGREAAFSDIRVGLRGEYRLNTEHQSMLYVSPIDNRLHLKWAEGGTWRLDGEEMIRVENLDGDEFIDAWSREMLEVGTDEDPLSDDPTTEPVIVEALFAFRGHLLYGGEGKVTLVETDYQPSVLETLPPTDHDTWQAHRGQLAPYEAQRRDPRDIAGWLDAFPGERTEIVGATLANVRPTDAGFRFELSLEPGFRYEGAVGPALGGLVAGDYAVTYQGSFSVLPLTPARVEVVPGSLDLGLSTPVALDPVSVGLQLRNAGLEDLDGLEVQVHAEIPGSEPELVRSEVVELPAGDTFSLRVPWTPPIPGDWRLTFTWGAAEETCGPGASGSTSVDLRVGPALVVGAGQILELSTLGSPAPVLALLVALVCFASALALLLARSAVRAR